MSGHLDDATATTGAGGRHADLPDLFCTAERCPMIVGNTLVFRDDNHVTTEYARLLAPVLGALVDQAVTGG
jgi:hypothetical protein